MKRVAILTSGGDAPGMNAAIRAIVRCATAEGWQAYGVERGYSGLIEGRINEMNSRSVSNIIQRGGTMLGSARCSEFRTEEGRMRALRELQQRGIDALVVIGGNGTQTGALNLSRMGFPVVGVASTIDNDLCGSDITIGVDTALNIALEAIDRIKTTASSHQRAFLIEVMGRDCGYLALMCGIAGGAEVILIPEVDTTTAEVEDAIRTAYSHGKAHAIVVVAEGAKIGAAALGAYCKENRERIGFGLRVTTLGHVQRGGAPTAFDRILATRLGAGAVEALKRGEQGVLVGMIGSEIVTTPLEEIAGKIKPIDPKMFELAKSLDR